MPGIIHNVADIKAQARDVVDQHARGASKSALIANAEKQFQDGQTYESTGDLPQALAAYIKSAGLARAFFATSSQDPTDQDQFNQFMQARGEQLTLRARSLTEKLEAMNQAAAPPSVAERKRQLEGSGLNLTSSSSASASAASGPPSPAPPLSPANGNFAVGSSIPTVPTALVPPSAFHPPSPDSPINSHKAPSSPINIPATSSRYQNPSSLDHVPSVDDFARDYPPVDQIENDLFPTPPTSIPISPPTSFSPSTSPTARRFALGNGIERPGSTPLTPTTFVSRPTSPVPTRKPSRLIPTTNTVSPSELKAFLRDYKVLLVDIRHRQQFDDAHIKTSAIVCVEPAILQRDGINADKIEEALVVAPAQEASMFKSRDKFDIVAFYDEDSTAFGESSSLPSTLVRVLHEQAFKKVLKRIPMLLIGGFGAWREQFGVTEIEGSSFISSSLQSTAPRFLSGSNSAPGLSSASTSAFLNSSVDAQQRQSWATRSRPDTTPVSPPLDHKPQQYSLDQSAHSRSPAEFTPSANGYASSSRKPLARPPSRASISHSNSPILNGTASVAYSPFQIQKTPSGPHPPSFATITPPPQASISPSTLTKRRGDFIDQSQEALASSGAGPSTHQSFGSISASFSATSSSTPPSFNRPPIDYPDLLPSMASQQSASPHILRPPPPAAPPTLERQRPPATSATYSALNGPGSKLNLVPPEPPRIGTPYPVVYWNSHDGPASTSLVRTGLKNLGNTCYMNATVQCLSASVPVVRFFSETKWQSGINYMNKLGTRGVLTQGFAALLLEMIRSDLRFLSPSEFRKTIGQVRPQYSGTDQHDSQEFLSFLLDAVHEDMNRVLNPISLAKTPEEEEELERLPVTVASEREWQLWKRRNDSIIVDYFQGQFRSRLECLVCGKTSTTYNVFSMLQVPIPHYRSAQRVLLQSCLEALFNTEILEKDDAWDCPRCKAKRRARKQLSLARLPPILLIHLKRFETHGRFSDKIDSFVEFPLRHLDLTGYMPETHETGHVNKDDPRAQAPPYKYDLYGVTNHFGNLSSGHYTAFVQSRDKWMYCDDSAVKESDASQVVTQRAYVLFYRRAKFY